MDSWKVKYNNLEEEVNALAYMKIYCENLKKDIKIWWFKCVDLQQRVIQLESSMELECFRAVDRQRKQWESHEERLVQQLRELQQQLAPVGLLSGVKSQQKSSSHRLHNYPHRNKIQSQKLMRGLVLE